MPYSMPHTAAALGIQGGTAGITLPVELAQRLEDLLGIPLELFLGAPGETTEERRAREAAAADILDADPLLAVRARWIAQVVAEAHLDGRHIVEFRTKDPHPEAIEIQIGRGPLGTDAVKAVA